MHLFLVVSLFVIYTEKPELGFWSFQIFEVSGSFCYIYNIHGALVEGSLK